MSRTTWYGNQRETTGITHPSQTHTAERRCESGATATAFRRADCNRMATTR
jgi:hypothetical protein